MQREQVVVEQIDSCSACACSRHSARPCARRKITHNETKTRASETHTKEQPRSVQSEPWEAHLSEASSLLIVLDGCYCLTRIIFSRLENSRNKKIRQKLFWRASKCVCAINVFGSHRHLALLGQIPPGPFICAPSNSFFLCAMLMMIGQFRLCLTVLVGLCDIMRGVPQVTSPFIAIIWV